MAQVSEPGAPGGWQGPGVPAVRDEDGQQGWPLTALPAQVRLQTSLRPLACSLLSGLVSNAGERRKKHVQLGLLQTGPGRLLRPFCCSVRSALALEWAALSPLRLFPSRVRAGWCPIQGQPPASCVESPGPMHVTPSF